MEARGRDKRTRSEDGGGGGGGGDEAAMDRTRMRYLRRLTVPGTPGTIPVPVPNYLHRCRVQYRNVFLFVAVSGTVPLGELFDFRLEMSE